MSYFDTTKHVPKFGGNIWYIDKGAGDDANGGKTPVDAFETIGAGITAMSDGDALNIKAGTYTETGLTLSNDYAEMWFEVGAVIDPVSGTALTISGASCKLMGEHKITPAAGAIGILVSGIGTYLNNGRIVGGGTGISFTGSGAFVTDWGCANQTVTAYDIQASQVKLTRCSTKGAGATYGYKISNSADTGVLRDCSSVGHTTAGYHIATGSIDWTIINCSSGAKDGKFKDTDSANVWSNFSYSDRVYKGITFSGATTAWNLFKVTGAVRISNIHGHVTTAIPATASTVTLQLYSSNATIAMSTASASIASAVVGANLIRNADSGNQLDFGDPNATPVVMENSSYRDPKTSSDVIADNGATTYVRILLSAALASGAIHFHCEWEPLDENGFLEAV